MCYNIRALINWARFLVSTGIWKNKWQVGVTRSDTLSLNLNITGNRNNYVPAFA